jgi:hypothetical protein
MSKQFCKRMGITAMAGLALTMLALPASAQPQERRATFIDGGGRDSGRCTIDIAVDKVAELSVAGDRSYVRTLDGEPARIERMECTGVMPRRMADFRLHSTLPPPRGGNVVGMLLGGGGGETGRVEMISDPRSNDGRAVIRIDDPPAGYGTYTLELSWNGGRDEAPIARDRDADRDRDRDRDRDADRDRRAEGLTFRGDGDGFFRHRDARNRILNCSVKINGDAIRASFVAEDGTSVDLTGHVNRTDGNRVIAEMSNSSLSGRMIFDLDRDQGRVRNVSMSDEGRNNFELRWHN